MITERQREELLELLQTMELGDLAELGLVLDAGGSDLEDYLEGRKLTAYRLEAIVGMPWRLIASMVPKTEGALDELRAAVDTETVRRAE